MIVYITRHGQPALRETVERNKSWTSGRDMETLRAEYPRLVHCFDMPGLSVRELGLSREIGLSVDGDLSPRGSAPARTSVPGGVG